MAKRDYYDVLGVPKNASDEDIKRAYRGKAKQLHPDANPGDKAAEEKFKELGEAYEALSDAQKRAAYDRFGHAGLGQGGPGGPGGFGGFGGGGEGGVEFGNLNEVFEEMLGGFFGGGGRRRRRPAAGRDLAYDMELTLEEAATGGERKLSFDRAESCGNCKGTGAKPGTSPQTCSTCNGRGQVQVSHGFFAVSRPCHKCHGRGFVIPSPCPSCRGAGQVHATRNLSVSIPAGVDNGMRIRLEGEGEAGEPGGARGDLYIDVTVHKHDLFARDGQDLILEVPLPFPLATAGGEVSVPTLEGPATMKVPPGTQTGQVFRLKGKGMPGLESRGRGDLLARVHVEIPRHLTKRQQELLKEFEKESHPDDYDETRRFAERSKRQKG